MKVCIAGGGRVGRYLAQSLLANRHEIVIIEPVESQCRMLADMLDIPVICGDSISVDTLRTRNSKILAPESPTAFLFICGGKYAILGCRFIGDEVQYIFYSEVIS